MAKKKSPTQGVLQGCRILIVEDDVELAQNMRDLYLHAGAVKCNIVHCVEQAIDESPERLPHYDLIVLDIMLPETQYNLDTIRTLQHQLKELRSIINDEDPDSDHVYRRRLNNAYDKRARIIADINSLIGKKAGLRLPSEWRKRLSTDNKIPTILFLTAVGYGEIAESVLKEIGEQGDFIQKPVSAESIIKKSAYLIKKVDNYKK